MADDPPSGSDSKLVGRVADKVKGQLALWVVAGLCTTVVGLVLAAWRDMGQRIDKIEELAETRADTIDAHRRADIAALQNAFLNHLEEVKPLRDRLTATELTAQRNREWIDRNSERISRIAVDLAEIRAQLRRGDHDRVDEKPAPPAADLRRIPMLWHL